MGAKRGRAPTAEQRRASDAPLRKWSEVVQPLIDAVRRSERLTAADYAVTINATDRDLPPQPPPKKKRRKRRARV